MEELISKELNIKLEIKISYLKFQNGLGSKGKNLQKLRDFYEFCKNFFRLWDKYLERITPLVYEFNDSGNSRVVKQIYAEIIYEQYEKYYNDLVNLKVPLFLYNVFNEIVDSIENKKNYFRIFSDNDLDRSLKKHFSKSLECENKFWLDLYNKHNEIGKDYGNLKHLENSLRLYA